MTKILVIFSIVTLGVTIVLSEQNLRNGRIFYPEETRNDKHFALIPDDNGKVHFVNLKREVKIESDVTIKDITMFLYTKNNIRDGVEIDLENFTGAIHSDLFNASRPTVITTHGWGGVHMSNTNRLTRDGVLAHHDANVLIVAWERPANEFYTNAVAAVPVVGRLVADVIVKMMTHYEGEGMRGGEDITLVGQSLGGQVIGVIGSDVRTLSSQRYHIATLVALDPAGLLFYPDQPDACLDPSDGGFVHVVHTNGGMLGMRSALGHADYYPNGGGMRQPGCGPDLVCTCAHYRAYWYWGESLIFHGLRGFRAVRCAAGYEAWKAGECEGGAVSWMGDYPVDVSASGDYFLDTAGEVPYALG